jgi:hypothetical protein
MGDRRGKCLRFQTEPPLKGCGLSGNSWRKVLVRSRKALIDRYDAIFTPEFQASILGSPPLDMFAKDEGVMLGAGQVRFGVDGRVNYLIH